MKTLEEIKAAVDAGQTVHWINDRYRVVKDNLGQYFVGYNIDGHGENYWGLTHVTTDYTLADFYLGAQQ